MLRWLAVLPAAFGASIVISAIVRFLAASGGGGYFGITLWLAAGGVMGYVWCVAASYVAPTRKFEVTVVFAVVAIMLSGALFYHMAINDEWSARGIGETAGTVGGAVAAIFIPMDQRE